MADVGIDPELIEELRRSYGVHTLILYGSHARNEATEESDVDVACFADVQVTIRDARRLGSGVFLDAFVYPTALARAPETELMKLCGGRVILDQRQLAVPLLEHLAELERQGPPAVPASELEMRRAWAQKMLARIRRDDVEAHYRCHWLLFQLLEDYFTLRGKWYRGPKRALADLKLSSPATFAAFERALAPGASLAALEELVGLVSS